MRTHTRLLDRIDRFLFDRSFTVFGCWVALYPIRCAMHGAINISTKRWGYVCIKPPTYSFGAWWPGYFYTSPNATPWHHDARRVLTGKLMSDRCSCDGCRALRAIEHPEYAALEDEQ